MENQTNNQEINKTEELAKQEIKKGGTNSLASAIIVAAIIISGSIFAVNLKKNDRQLTENNNSTGIDPISDKDFIRGNPSAKVSIIEYGDFSCSFCGRHHPTMKEIVEHYEGEVNWVFRQLPIFNMPAAVASTCVGNISGNDTFWEYTDILMSDQENTMNEEFLKSTAISLGVPEAQYMTCTSDRLLQSGISLNFNKLRTLAGINATPYNILVDKNGKMYHFTGALSFEEIKGLIDSIL